MAHGLLPAAVRRRAGPGALRRYLAANLVLAAALVPVMTGLVQRWAMAAGSTFRRCRRC